MTGGSSFNPHPGGEGEISEIALRVLVEFPDGETHVIGTATLLAAHLAVTAGHVLDDILERFGSVEKGGGERKIDRYAIRLVQVLSGPQLRVWQVFRAWKSLDTDLALLHLELFKLSHPAMPLTWRTPFVHFTHPPLGAKVFAFGFHSSRVDVKQDLAGAYHLKLDDEPTTSIGVVDEILVAGQPAGKFRFSCYRVGARFDGGMSGGPVFDELGVLRGIISGTLFPGDDQEGPISYVAMLWPLLRLLISINRGEAYPRDVTYPVIHLVRDGLIHAAPRCFDGLPAEWVDAWLHGEAS